MKAVISISGKQFLVSEDDQILVNQILGKIKEKIIIDKILLILDKEKTTIGKPYVDKAKVEAEIIELGKSKKVQIIKFKAKKRYQRKKGHRQDFTKIKIKSIKIK